MIGDLEYVDDVATAFADLVVREHPTTLLLSGGDTARRCYEVLATRSGVDWHEIHVGWGDERLVPVDHPDSNEGMARRELLDHVDVRMIHSMTNSTVEGYDAVIARTPVIDLIHLGMGPDGHTASLFPGSPSLDVTDRYVIDTGDELHPHPRRTLTFAGIALAAHVVVTVEGEEKADAWHRLLAGDDNLPASRIRAGRVTWLVDRALAP